MARTSAERPEFVEVLDGIDGRAWRPETEVSLTVQSSRGSGTGPLIRETRREASLWRGSRCEDDGAASDGHPDDDGADSGRAAGGGPPSAIHTIPEAHPP